MGQGSGRGEAPEVNVTPSDQNGFVRYRYRRNVLVSGVDERLKEILSQVAGEVGAEVIEIEVMPDHVHLLVEIPPPVAFSRFVQLAKGRSSRLLRQEFPRLRRLPCLWSPSWFVSTVGGAPLEVVRRYVGSQKPEFRSW